jgi:hypothetical protein
MRAELFIVAENYPPMSEAVRHSGT